MKFVTIVFFVIAFLLNNSCQQSNNQNIKQYGIGVDDLVQAGSKTDTLGPIIQVIDFKQKATDEELKIFKDGYIPWISVDSPETEINKLVDADKIILAYSSVTILIDYPLNNPAVFDISATGQGFSRKELIFKISKAYHEIYELEEATAKTKTIPLDKREGLINRNPTDGKYGVWGHDLSDLDLSQIEVHKNEKEGITLILDIES